MIQIFRDNKKSEWDNVVKQFEKYDVYYLHGYVKGFKIHGDGEPLLVYYESKELKAIFVGIKRNTDIEGCYDCITPYGYGGVLFEGNTSDDNLKHFWFEFKEKMLAEGIVDNFVRYHPILENVEEMKKLSSVTPLGKTIAFDLTSKDIIWQNITSKNRNMIRKAEKNGVEIMHGKGRELLKKFKEIYNSTMEKDNAERYYFFEDEFYQSIDQDLHDNYEIFYAVLDTKIIAMSIMIFANDQMHYHLSGSVMEYRNLAPSNLLLYKAALWGCENGFKTFHLGGGVGSQEDNLYIFKAAFNRNSDYHFYIGKEIFDQEKYYELVELRAEKDLNFNRDSIFFPLYRTP